MSNLVFIHGWSMGPEIWSPITQRLNGHAIQRADMGFRGTPAKPEADAPLVVAHSLGLMWALVNLPRPWAGAIVINGFTRFSRTDGFPGVEPRLLARMRSRLDADPAGVVGEFLTRCGVTEPNLQNLDTARLGEGLDWLAQWDQRQAFAALNCPLLALAGRADPIVTADHSRA